MKKSRILFPLLLSFGCILLTSLAVKSQIPPLEIVTKEKPNLDFDEQIWSSKKDRDSLIGSINNSLSFLRSKKAIDAYQKYPIPEITRERVIQSLLRFRSLLKTASSPEQLKISIDKEFNLYQAVGQDPQKTVIFTGYYEPIYEGSLTPTQEYRYPIYKKPSNFASWTHPQPTRVQLEGQDGLSSPNNLLAGSELVWLKNRMQAYLVEIQGSATIKLTDGSSITVGFDDATDYPYVSIGKMLLKDRVLQPNQISLAKVVDYLNANPSIENEYISRNNRFVFFRETHGSGPRGSIGVVLTAERSIATDKSLMPPGALAIIHTQIPQINQGLITKPEVNRYVLDQDAGSAIKGTGRVDIFMGTGKTAGERAGLIKYPGQLYYLLLKESIAQNLKSQL
jgi:membrane-bound lytic murein transglycosylase A